MPLVLVSNEVNATDRWDWDDETGVRYHFPNQYRGMIVPGEPFVYYRGIRRQGGRRGPAEYFGCGVVGDVWRDPAVPEETPKRNWAWYCSIEDYEPFDAPVAAKTELGFYEGIPANMWRSGVRRLAPDAYAAILAAARADAVPPPAPEPAGDPLPATSTLIETEGSLLLPRPVKAHSGASAGYVGGGRRSKTAKQTGDRAELIAKEYIESSIPGAHGIRHVAALNEKPGWDIEYRDASGRLQRVEVKGAATRSFANFELTAGELAAAKQWRQDYWVYLIADCLSASPRLQRINDPAGKLETELWAAPVVWRVWLAG